MVHIKEINGNEIDCIMTAVMNGASSIKAITEYIGELPRSNVRYYIQKLEDIGFAKVSYGKKEATVTLTKKGIKYHNKPVDIIIIKRA